MMCRNTHSPERKGSSQYIAVARVRPSNQFTDAPTLSGHTSIYLLLLLEIAHTDLGADDRIPTL